MEICPRDFKGDNEMKVDVLYEAGYFEALLGLSLSYEQPLEKMVTVAAKLAHKDCGHNKFLESIAVWLDITAARYWWQQFDTYRVGVSKQSGSTMHTVLHRALTQDDFEQPIAQQILVRLNELISGKYFELVKNELPEGFLQRRIVCTNYKVLRHIITQRESHRLKEWHTFCDAVRAQIEYPGFLPRPISLETPQGGLQRESSQRIEVRYPIHSE